MNWGRASLRAHVVALVVLFAVVTCPRWGRAQAGLGDDRVMLQGFYWESCRLGMPGFGSKRWYEIVKEKAPEIREGLFDLIWLPPPCYSSDFNPQDFNEGYGPKELFNLNNCYGSAALQREMLVALLEKGVEPIADIVINHRNGSNGWVDFQNPAWGTWAITANDDAFRSDRSGVKDLPMPQRGAEEDRPVEYTSHGGTTYEYDVYRDISHADPRVRKDIVRYLKLLQSYGYRGWRYDMVHGYHAKYIRLYNAATHPTFSVGEYDWGAHNEQRGWVWHTARNRQAQDWRQRLERASSVFDFSTQFALKENRGEGRYFALYGLGNGVGLIGDTTDGVPWKEKAVTFVENHDTGYRTLHNGLPEKDHVNDSFQNNWEVEQAYAYVLTHPGVPCVYWKHYFDWGQDLRSRIDAIINARKVAGVNAGSVVNLQDNARQRGVYAARVMGKAGALYVRIGGNDDSWNPAMSSYSDYREYARGAGWTVWVGLPDNPGVKRAKPRDPFVPPALIADAAGIQVDDQTVDPDQDFAGDHQ